MKNEGWIGWDVIGDKLLIPPHVFAGNDDRFAHAAIELLYRLADRWRAEVQVPGTPEDLLTDLEIALQTGFGVTLAVGESSTLTDNVRTRLIAPPRSSQDAQYTTPKDFTAIRFVPREPLAGQDIEGIVYAYKAGKIQMAVVCLLPRNTGAQFRERLTTALQTLVVSPDAPKPRKGTAGAPAGGANPGF